jgi:hypothetical protein
MGVRWGELLALLTRRAAATLEGLELLELERITADDDQKDALAFLKKSIYSKVAHSQGAKLKSHLDAGRGLVDR